MSIPVGRRAKTSTCRVTMAVMLTQDADDYRPLSTSDIQCLALVTDGGHTSKGQSIEGFVSHRGNVESASNGNFASTNSKIAEPIFFPSCSVSEPTII